MTEPRSTNRTGGADPDGAPAQAEWEAVLPTRALAAVAAAGASPYGTPGAERGGRSARLLEIRTSRADGRTIVRTVSERPGEPTTFVVLGAGAGQSSGEDGVIVDAERIAALFGTDPRIPEDPADTVGEETGVRLSKNGPRPAASPPTARWGVFTATRTDTGSSDVLSLPDWTRSILEPDTQSKRRRAEGPQEEAAVCNRNREDTSHPRDRRLARGRR